MANLDFCLHRGLHWKVFIPSRDGIVRSLIHSHLVEEWNSREKKSMVLRDIIFTVLLWVISLNFHPNRTAFRSISWRVDVSNHSISSAWSENNINNNKVLSILIYMNKLIQRTSLFCKRKTKQKIRLKFLWYLIEKPHVNNYNNINFSQIDKRTSEGFLVNLEVI